MKPKQLTPEMQAQLDNPNSLANLFISTAPSFFDIDPNYGTSYLQQTSLWMANVIEPYIVTSGIVNGTVTSGDQTGASIQGSITFL